MPTFRIQGSKPLFGSVRVGGAKNASYKLMIAALLADSPSRILNFSHISDVKMVASIIDRLGGDAREAGERCYVIDPQHISSFEIGKEFGDISRASTLFIPALLARFGQVSVPLPGGDKIGKRPLERHFEGLKALGVVIQEQDGFIVCTTSGMVGTTYRFEKNTHTGTETLIMAAVKAKGKTILENAALETEIDDLIEFLNNMGAKIERKANRVIEIQGVESLHGAIHRIMPDQNQVVSFASAALATKGDIIVENARKDDLGVFLERLESIGAGYEIGSYGIRFYSKGILTGSDVTTQPAPGFKTDWQPLWVTLMTQAEGESTLHETVYENRFAYTQELIAMGAHIELYNPKVDDPQSVYNFNLSDSTSPNIFHAARVTGPTNLQAGEFAVRDLRHGATLIVAGLCASGETILHDPDNHIDRGYEFLDRQLNSLGASIIRYE